MSTRSEAAKAANAERRARKRWYITINVKPAPRQLDRFGRLAYHKMVWPKLFKSEQEAWDFAGMCKAIWNPPPGYNRVISYALSTTYLPKP